MKKDNETDITTEDILNALGTENREEKLYKLLEFLTKDWLTELKGIFRNLCKSRYIVPLRKNTSKNIKKLYSIYDKKLPKESCNLLNQSYMTIKNVQKLVRNNSLVDSNTLIRSAFENLVMGMMIYLDSNVYEEFKKMGLRDEERVYTKQQKLRNLFKAKLKMIDKNMFGDMSNRQIQKLLDEYYDKLCLFTHSTLVVHEMVEGTLNNDEDLFLMIAKQNMYFLEILLNCCLKYITNDASNSIGYEYMFVGWYILISDINSEKYTKEYLSRYSGLLYEDINNDYLKQSNNDLKQLQEEMKKLDMVIKENPVAVIGFLESFLKQGCVPNEVWGKIKKTKWLKWIY